MRRPTPGQWADLEPVLDEAVFLPPEEAASRLREVCAGDQALLDWALRFLAGARNDAFPVTLSDDLVVRAMAHAETTDPAAGARYGPWRIVREVGRGGMGAVFLAERDDGQFQQQVALKLVPLVRGGDDARRRFVVERQILARLDHPNIARLIDGGITAQGQPWFAMEYVPGEPLDDYCDRRALSIEARLALFLAVCDAVQSAHQRLVIHRDLKPSNILVSADGQVKLLDFGIAKLVEDDGETMTHTGVRAFTPEYAAPEQWTGAAVTTATDTWALGVILHELLTGARPFVLRGRPESEWASLVLREPVRPLASQVEEGAAARRGVTATRLRVRVREDLDTIVRTALHTEADRRYRTVDQLAADVRRHLDGLPISARPDTWRYRTRKFVARHRAAVGAAAVAVLGLVGGSAGIAWQARVAAREAEHALAARRFLAEMFAESDPYHARGDSLTAGDMLDRAAGRIDATFAGQPEVRFDLLTALGEIYRNLGRHGAADTLLRRALPLADSLADDRQEARGRVRYLRATVLHAAGRVPEADTLARDATRIWREADVPDSVLAVAVGGEAVVARSLSHFTEADARFQEALALAERGNASREVRSGLWNDLGMMRIDLGQYRTAVDALRRSYVLSGDRPADDPGRVTALANLGIALDGIGRKDTAQVIAEEVLRLTRRAYPDGHLRVASAINAIAFLRMDQGAFTEADTLFREGAHLLVRLLGPGTLQELIMRNNAARATLLGGRTREAEVLLRAIWRDALAALGPAHGYVSQPVHWLGRLYLMDGRLGEAQRMLDSSLVLASRALPPGHERFTDLAAARGILRLAQGDSSTADSLLRWSTMRRDSAQGPGTEEAIEPTFVRATIAGGRGDWPRADSLHAIVRASLERFPWARWRVTRVQRTWDALQSRRR
ncbi:MAG: protein kinase [Gemmatimonadetes bacterium]|nr:protein kinase [Gemmatimonadota bacterium]